jgi:hypothetical protein
LPGGLNISLLVVEYPGGGGSGDTNHPAKITAPATSAYMTYRSICLIE